MVKTRFVTARLFSKKKSFPERLINGRIYKKKIINIFFGQFRKVEIFTARGGGEANDSFRSRKFSRTLDWSFDESIRLLNWSLRSKLIRRKN